MAQRISVSVRSTGPRSTLGASIAADVCGGYPQVVMARVRAVARITAGGISAT